MKRFYLSAALIITLLSQNYLSQKVTQKEELDEEEQTAFKVLIRTCVID